MLIKQVAIAAAFIASALTGAIARAQPPQPVELVGMVKVDKVVTENGVDRHVLSDPKVVVPGDHLIFSTAYHNVGAKPVSNFVVTNPVPAGVSYSAEDAAGQVVSVDGGKTWGALAQLSVTDATGARRAAQASDVTHVRWTLPVLAPGAAGTLSYKAIVR